MGKSYPEEFRRQAVELYRLDEEMTYAHGGWEGVGSTLVEPKIVEDL